MRCNFVFFLVCFGVVCYLFGLFNSCVDVILVLRFDLVVVYLILCLISFCWVVYFWYWALCLLSCIVIVLVALIYYLILFD